MPKNAILLTFDDGYHDNLAASQAMDSFGIKGTFFIPTGFVGGHKTFPWDFATHAILHSRRSGPIDLPNIGLRNLDGNRQNIIDHCVENLKDHNGESEARILSELAKALDGPEINRAPAGLYMTWDQLADLHRRGHSIAPHTVNHPAMTAISKETAIHELAHSKAEIERRHLGPADCFAYPYGRRSDHSLEIETLLRDQNYLMAFTGFGGFSSSAELKQQPFAIQRVMISNCHELNDFKMKMAWG